MHEIPPMRLKEAVSLHQKGNLAAAQRAYEGLLADAPEHPFLLGQLGALALKQGRVLQAESLLGRALRVGGPPRQRLCNLQRYLALLLPRKNRLSEARSLVANGIPDWPSASPPNSAERKLLLALVGSLIRLDQPARGLRLLEQAFPNRANDIEAITVEGRLHLAMGNGDRATRLLSGAVKLAPDKPAPLIALSATQARTGQTSDARRSAELVSKRFPYFRKSRTGRQKPTILVLNPPPREIEDPAATMQMLHFSSNFPAEFQHHMRDRYRFLSVFGNIAPDLHPWDADEPTVVLNNLVDEMEMSHRASMERVRTLVDRIGLPVINPPEAVVEVLREKNAERFEGIPGLKVPRMRHYEFGAAPIDTVVADIRENLGYPVILRHPSAPSSSRSLLGNEPAAVYLVSNAEEARESLKESKWSGVYAIELVDLRKREGWYRNLRAFCMGDEIVIVGGRCCSDWIVSGWFHRPEGIAFYRENPGAIENLRAILNNPERELGAGCLKALQKVRERTALDIFGIDFDIDDDGKVVLFEASPAMMIQHPRAGAPRDLWLPMEPLERVHSAFHRLVAKRMAERGPDPDRTPMGSDGQAPVDSESADLEPWSPPLRPVRSIGNSTKPSRRPISAKGIVFGLVLVIFVVIRLIMSLAESWH